MWTAGIFVLFPEKGYLLTAESPQFTRRQSNYEDIKILAEGQRSESYQSINLTEVKVDLRESFNSGPDH